MKLSPLLYILHINFLTQVTPKLPFSQYFITSTKFPNLNRTKRNLDLNLKVQSLSYTFKLIRINFEGVIDNKTQFYDQTNNVLNISFEVFEGFIAEHPFSSSVKGYLKNDNFYGDFQIGNNLFYIEEIDKYSDLKPLHRKGNAVIYNSQNWNLEELFDSFINGNILQLKPNLNILEQYRKFLRKGKLCSLLVIIDSSFLILRHGNNIKSTISQVVYSIEGANSIFRTTDFDDNGIPDNIGFYIKYVIVGTQNDTFNPFPKYKPYPVHVNSYLSEFTKYYLLEEVCLGVIFTAQEFRNKVLGLSYTALSSNKFFRLISGGICERPSLNMEHFNCLVITTKVMGEYVPQMLIELGLAHEIGHSFGSLHDDMSCFGHLMSPITLQGNRRKHYEFSKCSKTNILRTVVEKGHCLVDVKEPFCGNGIIEENEECDCGLLYNCFTLDKCCVPRSSVYGKCTINRKQGYLCHPSQGLCCTQNCQFRNLSSLNLNCKTELKKFKKCPCNGIDCGCGFRAVCLGNSCESIECARMNLKECRCSSNMQSYCQTCCLYENKCFPAEDISMLLGRRNTDQFVKNRGNYCFYKGEIGYCSKNKICEVPQFRYTYEDVYGNGLEQRLEIFSCSAKVCRTLFTADCGAGPSCSPTTSSAAWITASFPTLSRKKRSVLTPITIPKSKAQLCRLS